MAIMKLCNAISMEVLSIEVLSIEALGIEAHGIEVRSTELFSMERITNYEQIVSGCRKGPVCLPGSDHSDRSECTPGLCGYGGRQK